MAAKFFKQADANHEVIVLGSAARTVTLNSPDQENPACRGVRLYLDVTAASGTTPTLDVKVQTKDPASGTYADLPGAVFTQKTAVSFDDLTIYPGIAETANETVSDALSATWRLVATIGGGTPSFTFSVGAAYIR